MKQKQSKSWARRHRALLVLTGLCVTTATLYADLFGGDIALLGEILGQDTVTAEKDTVTAEQALKGVELATAMATHLHDKQWMKTFAADAGQLYLEDNYDINVNLGRVLNGDYQYGAQAAVQAWQETTTDPGDTGFLADDTPGVSGRLARLASIKFSDAAAGNCLQVLGQYRSHASANQAAHDLLSLTNLDGDDDSNSQVTQQNIGNGFAMQQLNELRSANALHSCQIQQQMAAAKFERDRQAEETAFERDMAAQPSTHLSGSSTLAAIQHSRDFQAGEDQ